MSAPLVQKQESARPVDPNVLQRRAMAPDVNVWVEASAGTGKTTILTGRILRLLLPAKGRAASAPDKILALTFTKAGANEMAIRLNDDVQEWAVIEESKLKEKLEKLLGAPPNKEQIDAARTLFAKIMDVPGGMKIMTIHSFCSSVLARFPLEAGLAPGFKALEENQSRELQEEALYTCLEEAIAGPGTPEGAALHNLAQLYNEDQIKEAISAVISERRQFQELLRRTFSVDGYYTKLCAELGIQPGITKENLETKIFESPAFPEKSLREILPALAESSKSTDQKNAAKLAPVLESNGPARHAFVESYKSIFLTNGGDIRKTLLTKEVKDKLPQAEDILNTEAERLYEIDQQIKAAAFTANARDLFYLAAQTLKNYTTLKQKQGALDFDDLILKTLDLVKSASAWVMYKLDQGLDHILVDEAQDTNPEQWEIIRALSEEFFSGQGAYEDDNIERTIFVVGDSKQSIFSFQRAAPEKYISMEEWFKDKITAAEKTFEPIPITISFRSVPAILKAVDGVFAQPHVQKGLGRNVPEHIPFTDRARQPGLVELWPLFRPKSDKEELDSWAAPISIIESYDPASQLAGHIARQIKDWIEKKEILPKTGKPVQPGDILILMRTRKAGALVEKLVRALKLSGIPVSGVDRMVLKDQLAVQDLMAAARFALQPDDDLSLAEFLKSPFIGWDEDTLFTYAHKRGMPLFQKIREDKKREDLCVYLDRLIDLAQRAAPFDFFSSLLNRLCPADRISGKHAVSGRLGAEAADPLDEFLNAALEYEQDHPLSLEKFLHLQGQDGQEIKRDLEEGGRAVRIMTVHASKGLQAPIVILPDTTRSGNARRTDAVFWPDKSGAPLPVFVGRKENAPQALKDWDARAKDFQDEEYRRLMYVAMTRAQDRLYVGGYTGKNKPIEECWYNYIHSGLSALEECEVFEFEGLESEDEAQGLRLTNPSLETGAPEKKQEKDNNGHKVQPLPDWVYKSAPEEPSPPRPLIPSRPALPEQNLISPLGTGAQDRTRRFKRGNLIHKLLQLLPDSPVEGRRARAENWLAQPGHELSAEEQKEIADEVMRVLEDPDFAPVFAPGSMAEVPVTGLVDEKTLISGQIDRLSVTKDEVFVVDFKTNRPPPDDSKDIPALYRQQMEAYTRALEKIYPDKKIRRALLWTYGPFLMEL